MLKKILRACAAAPLFMPGGCTPGENDSDGASADDGDESGPVDPVNPFIPTDLVEAVAALDQAVGPQEDAGTVKVSLIANSHGEFWTAAQIGTSLAGAELGCVTNWDATTDNLSASQVAIVQSKVAEEFNAVGVSAINPEEIEVALQEAVDAGVPVITFDSDARAGSVRTLYMGSINYDAGYAAGAKMVEVLAGQSGSVALFVGLGEADNAVQRIRGVEDALAGTDVSVAEVYVDNKDSDLARGNVETALDTHDDLVGLIGIYAYNGPAIREVLIERGVTADYKLVAFDLETATLEGLADGTVHAAIGQRPYWWGFLGVRVLFAMDRIGPAATLDALAPYLSGDAMDILSTGQDVVTPETIDQYNEYLQELGIPNQ
jgi:ribose transport system substrate-binding protein